MSIYIINYTLPPGDRNIKRSSLINAFLNEQAGTGTGDLSTQYRYNVDFWPGYVIYLKRPANLNKGCDFQVNVDGFPFIRKGRSYSYPTHEDIFILLNTVKINFPNEYNTVATAINAIYNCSDLTLPLMNIQVTDIAGVKHPVQPILLALKWLFMEQDCAYWNYSGRAKLYGEISSRGLV